jgi:hypothetical protein
MCYKVIAYFEDLQDNNYAYDPKDPNRNTYPRKGLEISKERIKELATNQNRQKKPLIKKVEEKTKKPKKADKE